MKSRLLLPLVFVALLGLISWFSVNADASTVDLDLSQGTSYGAVYANGQISLSLIGTPSRAALASVHSLVVTTDGKLWAAGSNTYGQLGDGTTTSHTAPIQVPGISGITDISAGQFSSAVLKSDGTVWMWGGNSNGQLGDGTTTQRTSPVQVSGLSGITAISVGPGATMVALKSDGTVWGWGANNYGQLGDGTTAERHSPVQASGLSGVIAVSAGLYHTLALKSDGTVWAWGNSYISVPSQVTGLSGITAIAGGAGFNLALKNDGTVWAWGGNTYGQLGDGTTTNRTTPAQISGLSGMTAVSTGYTSSFALKSDGTVWAWGQNSSRQLGDGTTTDRHSPVQVSGITSATSIRAGLSDTFVLKSSGTLWGWGSDGSGELGNSSTSGISIAVQGYTAANGYYTLNPYTFSNSALLSTSFTDTGSTVTYLFSVDGSIWKKWNGSNWTTTTLNSMAIGNTSSSAAAITGAQWGALIGEAGKLYITPILGNTSTPSVTQLSLNITPITTPSISISQSPSNPIVRNQSITYTANVSNCTSGYTCYVNWTINSQNYSGNTATVTLTPAGSYTATATVSTQTLESYPSSTGTSSVTTTVINMPPVAVSITAPSAILSGQAINVSQTSTSSYSPVTGSWTLPDGTTSTGATASYTARSGDPGTLTFTYTASVTGYPESSAIATSHVVNVTAPSGLTITGPSSGTLGDPQTFTVSAIAPTGTITYQITLPDGSVVNGNSATYAFTSTSLNMVTAKAYFVEAPNLFATASKSLTLNYPPPVLQSLDCPSHMYTYQQDTCTAPATAQFGTLGYSWKVDSALQSSTDRSATIQIIKDGTHTVTTTAYIIEQASAKTTASANINVENTGITLSVSCPQTFYIGNSDTCTATGTSNWGTLVYAWRAPHSTITQDGSSATFNYDILAAGPGAVTATMSIQESPNITISKTVPVLVTNITAPQDLTITGPLKVLIGSTHTYTISSTTHWGTPSYTITLPDGSQVAGASASFTFTDMSQNVVRVKACLTERAVLCSTWQLALVVNYPLPVIQGLSCPVSLYTMQQGTCTVQASAQYGTLQYSWKENKSTVNVANISFGKAGTFSVQALAYIKEDPTAKAAVSANISVAETVILATLTCPETLKRSEAGQCTVDASSNWGTLNYGWDITKGATIAPSGNTSASVMFPGSATTQYVYVKLSLAESPLAYVVKSVPVKVQWIMAPIIILRQNPSTGVFPNQQVTYTAVSKCPSGCGPINWTANGQSYTGDTVMVNYSTAGTYKVTAAVSVTGYESYKEGNASAVVKTVVDNVPKPILWIKGPSNAQAGLPMTLSYSLTSALPTTGFWTLPDGTTASQDTLTYTPREPEGTVLTFIYTATPNGYPASTSSAVKKVTVKTYHLADYKIKLAQDAGYVPMNAIATVTADTSKMRGFDYTLESTWDFGDGATSPDLPTKVSHIYTQVGTYQMTLTVRDNWGNVSTSAANVTVGPVPPFAVDIKLNPSNPYARAPITIYGKALIAGIAPPDSLASCQWTVDGRAASGTPDIIHYDFKQPGNHNISVTVKTKYGGVATKSIDFRLNANQVPVCDFSYMTILPFGFLHFKPTCADADGKVVRYKWDMDGDPTIQMSPYWKFKRSGDHTVTLTATDDCGAAGSVTKTVTSP